MTATDEPVVDEPVEPHRSAIRPVHVVTVAVAALVLAGAVIFVLLATSARDDASHDRQRAEQQLRDQRAATRDAQDQMVAARSAAKATIASFGGIIGSAQGLADIAKQEVDAAQATHDIGAVDEPSVSDYNASVQHGNDVAGQYNTTLQAVRDKLQAIARDLNGQIA